MSSVSACGAHVLLLLLGSISLLVDAAKAEPRRDEGGLPLFSEHFAPRSYDAPGDNWWIAQDRRGVMYVANNQGVLEFDGVNWRLIRTPTVVRTLAVDRNGMVYVGLIGDLGRLEPNARGELRYVSLLTELEPEDRLLGDVWTAHAMPDGIYFQGRHYILRWNGVAFKKWSTGSSFHVAYATADRYFVRSHDVGLLELKSDELTLVPGGEAFARHPVWALMEVDGRVVVGTREKGLLEARGGMFVPFPTEADDILAETALYHGTVLPDGHIALATRDRGVIVLDSDGRLRRTLDARAGLPDLSVNHVFTDSDGALWIAFNSQGVMRVDVISPLSVFDRHVGLHGVVHHMTHHRDALYLSTGAGLYELGLADRRIRRIHTTEAGPSRAAQEVWASESFEGNLLVATTRGLLLYDGDRFSRLTSDRTYSLLASAHRPGRIYAGTDRGLTLIDYAHGEWQVDDRLPLVGGRVNYIVEEPEGAVWFRAGQNVLYRLTAPVAGPVELRRFDPGDGVPDDPYGLSLIGGAVAIVHHTGLYRFWDGESIPRFRLETTLLSPHSPGPDSLLSVTEDNRGRVWMLYADRTEIGRAGTSSYSFHSPEVLRLRNRTNPFPYVYVEDSGIAWLTHEGQLVRYDQSLERQGDSAFPTLMRRVTPVAADWAVFGGAFVSTGGVIELQQPDEHQPRLAYSLNHLRFDVAAASYSNRDLNEYQFMLEGHDEEWSRWDARPYVIYANLSGGNYKFRARARNAHGLISTEATYAFAVRNPWYRTWWAYGIYVMLGGTVIVLGVHYRRMRSDNLRAREQARELALERAVNERLQQVNDRLRQADVLKDQLLSNTSHELRTPITAILGFTSVLKDEAPQSLQEYLENIEQYGHRLMRTVTSMVDFARLQSGAIEIQREAVDVGLEVGQVTNRLAHAARRKQLRLEYHSWDEGLTAWLDRKCLERIVENVVGNAIKFTEEGSVGVAVTLRGDWVVLRVEDTGIGIDDAFLPDLFRALHDEEIGSNRFRQGYGLGLAITGRLVELMDGEIEVETQKGQGTVVTISFPMLYVAHRQSRESDSPSAA